jgi:hypothetical protein
VDEALLRLATRNVGFVSIRESTIVEFVRRYAADPTAPAAWRLFRSQAEVDHLQLIGILVRTAVRLWTGEDPVYTKIAGTRFLIEWLMWLRSRTLVVPDRGVVTTILDTVDEAVRLTRRRSSRAANEREMSFPVGSPAGVNLVDMYYGAAYETLLLDNCLRAALRRDRGEAAALVGAIRSGPVYRVWADRTEKWLRRADNIITLGAPGLAARVADAGRSMRWRADALKTMLRFYLPEAAVPAVTFLREVAARKAPFDEFVEIVRTLDQSAQPRELAEFVAQALRADLPCSAQRRLARFLARDLDEDGRSRARQLIGEPGTPAEVVRELALLMGADAGPAEPAPS